jgi:hypothetical protein
MLAETGEATFASGPLRVRHSATQGLQVGRDREPDWLGPARFVADALDPVSVRTTLRALDTEPVVVLRLEAAHALTATTPDGFATPSVAWHFDPSARGSEGAPDGMRAFGYQYTEFALPVFSDAMLARWRLLPWRPAVVLPMVLVAPDGRAMLLAPLLGFHEQIVAVPSGGDDGVPGLRAGWHGDVGEVPAGFATELAIIAGEGVRDCFAIWARLLRAAGTPAPNRDADTLGTRISYWTDNGSAYWYRTAPELDIASSIVAAVDDLGARGIPVGSVQLDSWWYPHEIPRSLNVDDEIVPPTGMLCWEPRADMLPDGIPGLRARLGHRPLVAHCRHLSSQTVYADEFPMWSDADRAHPVGPELYDRLLDQAAAWGVEVFEHDWLVECFLGVRGLRAAGRAAAWQEGIDAALGARDVHAQWCMATPADFAQTTRLHHITSIRTSSDYGYLVGPEVLWAWFLHTNVMARALGLWPYKDVFHSARAAPDREIEALLAALSAGPVGVGDAIGEADPALIRRTCRADGVLVRPDVPLAAIDRAAFDAPVWSGALLVGSAHSQHASGRWGYVVTVNVAASKERASTRIALDDVGADRPAGDVVMFDWRRQRVDVVAAGDSYDVELNHKDWDLRVLAPVLLDRLAVIGDTRLYATAGDARVADVAVDADGGGVTVTVLGAEETVTIAGWARDAVDARSWSPSGGTAALAVDYSNETNVWRVDVPVGGAGWTRVHLR